jgi:23S rRNA pseudouridine1911/1915/1917 synthase
VIVVAKTENAMVSLAKQFKQREIHKEYLAVVWDTLSPPSGTIRTMIGRHLTDRKKMTATTQKGRLSITRYETVETYKKSSLVRLFPETGRTHQIRVHLAHLQHPVMGDRQYGRRPARELPFFAGKPHGTGPSARLTARLVGARRDRLPPVEIAFLASQGASPVEVGRQMLHAHKISLCHPETGKKMEFAAPLPEDMKLLLDYLRRKD